MQPKTRPTSVIPSRYASLPSNSPPRLIDGSDGANGNPNIYIGRNFIGIGISAVHDAVLRGGARMPGNYFTLFFICETILLRKNENYRKKFLLSTVKYLNCRWDVIFGKGISSLFKFIGDFFFGGGIRFEVILKLLMLEYPPSSLQKSSAFPSNSTIS